jgi:hypothetical protein
VHAGWLNRKTVLLTCGLGGMFHEVVLREGPERPFVLLALLTMMGLASFLKVDELLSKGVQINLGKPQSDKETANGGVS